MSKRVIHRLTDDGVLCGDEDLNKHGTQDIAQVTCTACLKPSRGPTKRRSGSDRVSRDVDSSPETTGHE